MKNKQKEENLSEPIKHVRLSVVTGQVVALAKAAKSNVHDATQCKSRLTRQRASRQRRKYSSYVRTLLQATMPHGAGSGATQVLPGETLPSPPRSRLQPAVCPATDAGKLKGAVRGKEGKKEGAAVSQVAVGGANASAAAAIASATKVGPRSAGRPARAAAHALLVMAPKLPICEPL